MVEAVDKVPRREPQHHFEQQRLMLGVKIVWAPIRQDHSTQIHTILSFWIASWTLNR